jgi:hypothetical protein
MKQRSLGFKLVATLVIVSLQALALPVMASDPGAAVNGSILAADDQSPLVGAKLHLGDPQTGEIYTSKPAGEDGSFVIDEVPAAVYEMAVEADGGLYVVQTPLKLTPGQNQALNLAVTTQLAPGQMADSPEEEEKKKKKGGAGVWNNPATAALIVIGAAIVLGVIIDAATDDDDERPASP